MTETSVAFRPDWVSPPGDTIADLLEETGWSQTDLATRTGFSRKHINELIAGKTALTPDAALKLEAVLGGTARFWLSREGQYRELLARRSTARAYASDGDWLHEIPLNDMVRFKWVARLSDVGSQVAECLKFFGVASVSAWREAYEKPLAAFRASEPVKKNKGAIAAWLRQGERAAATIDCQPFDETAFRASLREVRRLTREREPRHFVAMLRSLCSKHGVAVVFVPAPKGCPASGATRWLTPERAVLQLSLRYRSNDQLWFTFFHEAGHLVLHRRTLFLEDAGAIDETQEAEANRFACDELIPRAAWQTLPAARSAAAVEAFAARVGVAPGIVVGRMQKERLLPWSHLNALKVRYRWVINDAQ